MRLLLGILMATCWLHASEAVKCELSLAESKTLYKTGEAIRLSLTFTANEPGLQLNLTTTQPASPIDTLVVSPMDGVFNWLEDQAAGNRYSPDYSMLSSLEVDKPQTVELSLNDVYRFDAAGHYSVQVISSRVSGHPHLASNFISFDVEPMSEKEEAATALELEQKIRQASRPEKARKFAEELDWLSGDAATAVKVSLFVDGLGSSQGLWIARNRDLVVQRLESALRDPTQPVGSLLQTTVGLKVSLTGESSQKLQDEYLKEIAATLPQRKGESLIRTAQTIFVELARRTDFARTEFAAAREVMLTHFADVDEYSVDWLLDQFGAYLEDQRIVPALEKILERQHDPIFQTTRTAVLRQLMKISPEEGHTHLVQELCAGNPVLTNRADDFAAVTLPETDECLKRQVSTAQNKLKLSWALAAVSHFASAGIYSDVLALYQQNAAVWDGQAKGYALAYLIRWDATRGLPLLESALPASSVEPDFNITYALNQSYSPNLETFWRKRLQSPLPGQVIQAAYALSQHGPADDQALLQTRLEKWRAAWAGRAIPANEGRLEAELASAVTNGKSWKHEGESSKDFRLACLSEQCRSRFPAPP